MESHGRTIMKALSWRIIATFVTFFVALMITGQLKFAAEIGLADTVIKLGAYYLHERTWMRVKFGTLKTPEYQI
jgi:uncharacterized membrane protein